MTQNQIAYWNYLETARSNRAKEAENVRHNTTTEKETTRHNLSDEGIAHGQLSESIRHNQATEMKDITALRETARHNLQYEQYLRDSNQIAQDRAVIEGINADTGITNAETNRLQANAKLLETGTSSLFGKTGILPWLVTGGATVKAVQASKAASVAAQSAKASATAAKLSKVDKISTPSIAIVPTMGIDIFRNNGILGNKANGGLITN